MDIDEVVRRFEQKIEDQGRIIQDRDDLIRQLLGSEDKLEARLEYAVKLLLEAREAGVTCLGGHAMDVFLKVEKAIADMSTPEPAPQKNEHPAIWPQIIARLEKENRDSTDPVYVLILKDMRERDAAGRAKYGTPLQPFNGRNALLDAYQEALDLLVYSEQDMIEQDKGQGGLGFLTHLDLFYPLFCIRRELARREAAGVTS